MMIVLVCLAVLLAVAAATLAVGRARRRQARLDERRLQAEWLAESGLDRAAARLDRSPDYGGETWDVPAVDLDGLHAGRVVIEVDRADRRVRIRADFPADGPESARNVIETRIPTSKRNPEKEEG
jgi:type II secretory pathway component PulK